MKNRRDNLPQGFYFTNTIFIHIPKCAGQAVGYSLYGHTIHHFKITEVARMQPKLFSDAFKFSVVRDPVDRYVSAFSYLQNNGRSPGDARIKEKWLKNHTIDSFADSLLSIDFDNEPSLFHFHTQNSFLCDLKNKHKILVDRVYRIEELDCLCSDFSLVSKMKPCSTIKKVNKSKRNDIILSENTKDIIRELYSIDYVQFF